MTMTNQKIIFESVLSTMISGYIEEKRAVGHKYDKAASLLKQFDTLAAESNIEKMELPKDLIIHWTAKKPNETSSTRNGRISIMRGLASYMIRLGYPAYVYPKATISIDRYAYIPYIFSKKELKSIFNICDAYPVSNVSPNRHLILPILFRILYGCGLRISEALNLKLKDIDFDQGTLFIREAKFGKERIVPMDEMLKVRCRLYADKTHSLSDKDTYFFPSPYGGAYKGSTIYKLFREILWTAGISHSGKGPRLHDFRHTFAVHCLKKWVLNDEDITNLMPYLSTFLGHNDLRGTQHYLRLTADLYPQITASVEQCFSTLIPEVSFDETD